MGNIPSLVNVSRWLNPRSRRPGSWAFILNRLSAVGLTVYLGLHLVVLNKLAQGAETYDNFVAFSQLPVIKVGEVILIAAVVFHGLNGLRIMLHAFAIGIHYQKQLFIVATVVTIMISALLVMRLFGG